MNLCHNLESFDRIIDNLLTGMYAFEYKQMLIQKLMTNVEHECRRWPS